MSPEREAATIAMPPLFTHGILQGREGNILRRIADPGCGAAIRQRQPMPEYHVGRVRARLICTYRGSGTQFGLGRDASPVLPMAAGDVAILRGTLWPGLSEVLHRSPHIAGSDETRLLVIDPVSDEEDGEHL